MGTKRKEAAQVALILALLLNAIFFPVLWGGKTLLESSWDAPSIMGSGAYDSNPIPQRIGRTPDPGAPAWQIEPLLKIISNQYWKEHHLPLWNPDSAYGTPLAAAMQPQPYYPLAVLLSIAPTSWTYNFFIVGRLFVAGLLMFLFARLFLSFIPSLLAAVTFMLTGYFILYLNMPHLSVEVLLPGIFLTFELLLRENSWRMVVAAATMIFLCVTGGMPESLFLVMAFGCLYFVFRLAVTPEFRKRPLNRLMKLAVAVGLGFALSAFLLLPFLEFIRISHDTHQARNMGGARSGLDVDDDLRANILYLLPLIFGPVGNSIFSGLSGWTGMRSYWGITPCLFGTAAVLCCFVRRNISYPSPLRLLTAFFAVSLALMLLKRFGNPIINWIGYLPVFDLVVFVKYQEPLMAFCVAMLGGIGFSLLIEKRVRPVYILAAAGVVLVVTLALAGWSLPRVSGLGKLGLVYYLNLLAGVLVIAVVLLLMIIRTAQRWWTWGFVGLLTLELCFNFLVPSFYLFNTLPSTQRNPYCGAPYIDFIKAHDSKNFRVFGREGNLYPNWAGVFGLADVRSLDALYYRAYIKFIRSFLLKPGDERRSGDLADRFTGSDDKYPYAFDTDLQKRFLVLSSIKYLISTSEYGYSTKLMGEIVEQHRAEKLWGFGVDTFQVGNRKSAMGLFQHPPSHRISYKTVIDAKKPIFEGVAAIKAAAQDKTSGVRFKLEIDAGGKVDTLFSTFLNPREVPADRAGRPFLLDLSRYAGREVKLLFSTDTAPGGNNAFGWAGWAKLRFASGQTDDAAAKSQFRNVYDKEVNVYEVPDVLPRASIFRAVEILPQSQVLQRLKDPTFDPEQKVILSRESLSDANAAALQALANAPSTRFSAADITRYDSQHVQIATHSDAPAVLMLNDANYPGWRVYLDGKPAPLLKADYLFRAVVLPAGNSVVEFAYEPASFRFGVFISAGALTCLAFAGALSVWRRQGLRRAADPQTSELNLNPA